MTQNGITTFLKKQMGLLALALTFLAVFFYRYSSGDLVPYDSKDEYYPLLRFAANQVENGLSPLWNSAHYSGFPVAGDPQSLIFSPLMLLGMIFLGEGPYAYDFLVYAHLFVGAACIYMYGLKIKSSSYLCFLSAVIFAFGGVVASRLQHTPIILTYSYFAVFFYLYSTLNSSILRAAIVGFVLGGFLIHVNQTAFILTLFFMLWVAFFDFKHFLSGRTYWTTRFIVLAVALVTSAVPFYHYISVKNESPRQEISLNVAHQNSMTEDILGTIALPNYNGNISGTYSGPGDITESWLYIGALPLLIILLSVFLTKRTRTDQSSIYFLLFLISSSFFLALGRNSFLYEYYYSIPGADNFRRPSDFLFTFNFYIAILLLICGKSINPSLFEGSIKLRGKTIYKEVIFWPLCLLVTFSIVMFSASNRLNSYKSNDSDGIVFPNDHQDLILEKIEDDPVDSLGVPYRVEVLGSDMFWKNNAMSYGIYTVYGYNPLRPSLLEEVYGQVDGSSPNKILTQPLRIHGLNLTRMLGIRYLISSSPSYFEAMISASNSTSTAPPLSIEEVNDYVASKLELYNGHSEEFFEDVYKSALSAGVSASMLSKAIGYSESRINAWAESKGYPLLDVKKTFSYLFVSELSPQMSIMNSKNNRNVLYKVGGTIDRVVTPKKRLPTDIDFKVDFNKVYLSDASSLDECNGDAHIESVDYNSSSMSVAYSANKPSILVVNEIFNPRIKASVDGIQLPIYKVNFMVRGVCVPAGNKVISFTYPLLPSYKSLSELL